MSKVPQSFHEKYFKLRIARNIVQIPNWKIAQPIELKIEENWQHYYDQLMIMTIKNNENTILRNSDPFDPKVVQILKLTYWLRNKDKYLVLTNSSLILH